MANFAPDELFPPVPNICNAEKVSTLSLFDLTGKTALVTGGNGGIGSGMARGLAEAGADIIIIQIPGEVSTFASDLAATAGRRVDVYECDLGNSKMIRETVDQILQRDGRQVDILCNCAGITGGFVPVLAETDEHRELVRVLHATSEWHQTWMTDVQNAFHRSCKSIIMQSTFSRSWSAGIWRNVAREGKSSTLRPWPPSAR